MDALILGAGAAGLAAARDLAGAGKRVCVLEARDRVGGRMHTIHLPDVAMPIELGAEFIHGQSETTFAIVDAAALLVHELPDTHWWSRDGKWERVHDFWSRVERVRARIRGTRDRSFAEFLREQRGIPPRTRELATNFVEGYHAAHADRISALSLKTSDEEQDEPDGNKQFRIASGYDSVTSWLRAGITPDRGEIRTSTVVSEIEWSAGSVIARTDKGEFRARAAVITVPAGVLKAPPEQHGSIRFTPELRQKRRALDKIELGHVVKIIFRFRERFWDEPKFVKERMGRRPRVAAAIRGPLNFVHAFDRHVPTWWTSAPARTPLLTAWAGGHAADALLTQGGDAMIDLALESLARTFRVERSMIDSLLAGAHTHDWQADPFSRGAYSYAAVGGSDAHDLLARPVKGTLFFAGEATSSDETGTVSGAIASGRRAAREVLAAL